MDTTTVLQTPAGKCPECDGLGGWIVGPDHEGPRWIQCQECGIKPKLDIGCGSKKQSGFIGLDRIAFEGVDHVLEIGTQVWPFNDNAVSEAYTSHFVEHLSSIERVHFCNELYRVLVPGGKCTLIVPHWGSCRAYGDPTHQWPPIGEFWFYYLSRPWRSENAPHTDIKHWSMGFDCDFEVTWGYGLSPAMMSRNAEFQQFAVNHYREAIQDIHASLTKR